MIWLQARFVLFELLQEKKKKPYLVTFHVLYIDLQPGQAVKIGNAPV